MLKRTVALFLCISILCGIMPVFAAEVNHIILVNEVFDDYAFNGQPSSAVNIVSGLDARVVERKGTNKALYSRMWGNDTKITFPLNETYDNMVFSYDVMFSESNIVGSVLKFKGGGPALVYNANGRIVTDDNNNVSSYKLNKWQRIAIAINFSAGTYSLYEDGKCLLKNRYFYSTPVKPTEFDMSFSSVDEQAECGVYIDNVRVYEGSEILPDSVFPVKSKSSQMLEYEEATQAVSYDRVFIDSNGNSGITASVYQKDNTVAKWDKMPGDNSTYLHFIKMGKNDCFADITTGITDKGLQKYVLQMDIYPVYHDAADTTANIANLQDANGTSCQIMKMYTTGRFLAGGDTPVCNLPWNQWSTIAVACNLTTGTCDAYVNGQLIKSDIPMQNGGVIPTKIRMGYTGTTTTGGYNETWYNRIKLYEGLKIREFDDVDHSAEEYKPIESDDFTYNMTEKSEYAQTLLQDDTVFMVSNTKCYINRKKMDYSDLGLGEAFVNSNGIVMVPAELISKAFGMDININSDVNIDVEGIYKLTVGSTEYNSNKLKGSLECAPELKDGIVYLPISSFARDVLKKYVYSDTSFVLISNSNRNYSNNVLNKKEHIDLIQRYLLFDRPSGDEIYNAFKKTSFGVHPRVFTTAEELGKVKEKIKNDDEYLEIYKNFISTCENYAAKPLAKYEKPDGLRLAGALATNAGGLIWRLSIGYLLTGDEKYAERVWQELENILSWDDWNCDDHFLDSGEAVPEIVLGYDAIYNYLTPERREFFKENFQRLYLDYAVGVYNGTSKFRGDDARLIDHNWGAVCGAGMLYAAFCLMDEEDENSILTKKCKYLASQALQGLEFPVMGLYPAGATDEGFVYWEYYISNLSECVKLLKNLCGTEYNLFSAPGIADSLNFVLYAQSLNGAYPFSNTTFGMSVRFPVEAFLCAKLTGKNEAADALYTFSKLTNSSLGIKLPFYYDKNKSYGDINYSLDRYFPGAGGNIELVAMKSSWNNPKGLYLASHGGAYKLSAWHPGMGSFIFDALGERWFDDLGTDEYNLPAPESYWQLNTQKKLYRLRTEGHNSIVINPTHEFFGQEINEYAGVKHFESKDRGSIAVYDLKDVYKNQVTSYNRGYMISDDRQTALIQDEVTLIEPSEIYSFMHTQANISLNPDGKSAVFSKNGKQLLVQIESDIPSWELKIMDAEPLDKEHTRVEGEYSREGFRKLAFYASQATGSFTITMKLIPLAGYYDYETLSLSDIHKIADWKIPEGELSYPALSYLKANGENVVDFMPDVMDYVLPLPYGSAVPYIEAGSDNSAVEIKQAQSLQDAAEIVLTDTEGNNRKYTITFIPELSVVNQLTSSVPTVGLPQGAKVMNSASVYANHEPQSNHLAPCAIDGDFKTSWTSNNDGTYIEIDLGEVREFDGIALAFLSGDQRLYSYELLISEDKQNYKKVFIGKSTGKTAEYEALPLKTKGRYIRLIGHFSNQSSWNNLAEIAVYSIQ